MEMQSPGAHWNNRRAYAQFLTQTRETSDQQEPRAPPAPQASCPRSTALALLLLIVVIAGVAAAFRMDQLNVFLHEGAPPPEEVRAAPAEEVQTAEEVHDPQRGPRVVDAPIRLR